MTQATAAGAKTTAVEVLIIGSGFGGICTAIRLKQAGIDNFVVLEKDGISAAPGLRIRIRVRL